MKATVLMGSPRKDGNTQALLDPFLDEWKNLKNDVEIFRLYELELHGCTACRTCQDDWNTFGCRIQDDMQSIFDDILTSELILLATPIYSWYCTPPMKAVLDRLVYGMNKYYGESRGPAIWAGTHVAILTTCGYRPDHGADLLEEGIRRYCRHSRLVYDGMLAERDPGYKSVFMDETKSQHAREFARTLHRINSGNSPDTD